MTTTITIEYKSAVDKAVNDAEKLGGAFKKTGAAVSSLAEEERNLERATLKAEDAAARLARSQSQLSRTTDPNKQRQLKQEVMAAEDALFTEAETITGLVAKIDRLETESGQASSAQDKLAASSARVTTAAQTAGTATNETGAASVGLGAGLRSILPHIALVTGALYALKGGYEAVKKAAVEAGGAMAATDFDKLERSIKGVGAASLQIFGIGKLAQDAAKGFTWWAEDVSKLAINFYELIGVTDAETAAAARVAAGLTAVSQGMKKVYDDAGNLNDRLKDLLQTNNALADNMAHKGSLYSLPGTYNPQTGGTNYPIPSRDIGGPMTAGQPYRVHRDEIMVPQTSGYMLNRRDAMAAAGGGGGGTTIQVVVQAGAFLGDRSDATRFANYLAPYLQQAARRGSGSAGIGGA